MQPSLPLFLHLPSLRYLLFCFFIFVSAFLLSLFYLHFSSSYYVSILLPLSPEFPLFLTIYLVSYPLPSFLPSFLSSFFTSLLSFPFYPSMFKSLRSTLMAFFFPNLLFFFLPPVLPCLPSLPSPPPPLFSLPCLLLLFSSFALYFPCGFPPSPQPCFLPSFLPSSFLSLNHFYPSRPPTLPPCPLPLIPFLLSSFTPPLLFSLSSSNF